MSDSPGTLFRSDFSNSGGFVNPMTAGGDIIYGATFGTAARLANGSSGQLLASFGSTNAPQWSYPALSRWSGYHDNAYSWSITSGSFADATNTAVGSFVQRSNSGFGTVTTAASNLPGITFTPPSAAAVYLVMVGVEAYNNTTNQSTSFQLTDGTNVVDEGNMREAGSLTNSNRIPLSGVWAPGTASAVTLKLKALVTAGTGILVDTSSLPSIQWTLVRIA